MLCTSFIMCTAVCCGVMLALAGLLALGASLYAYFVLLLSAKVQCGMFVLDTNTVQLLLPIAAFMLIGVLLLACGVYSVVRCKPIEKKPTHLIVVGAVVLVIGVCLLLSVLCCLLFIYRVDGLLDRTMYGTLHTASASPGSESARQWDNVHSAFSCCGITDGGDWLMAANSLNWTAHVPASCGASDAAKMAQRGCKDPIQEEILWTSNLACAIVGVSGGCLVVNALVMMLVAFLSWRDTQWLRAPQQVQPLDGGGGSRRARTAEGESEYYDGDEHSDRVTNSRDGDTVNGRKKSKTVIIAN